VSDKMTLAEYRHPEMLAAAARLQQTDDYQAVMAAFDQVLAKLDECEPLVKARAAHDIRSMRMDDLTHARGSAIHDLAYDHAYEEVAALLGLTRQRVWTIAGIWRDKTGEAWPKVGRLSRMQARRARAMS
jgi:hypothetical protein